MRLWRVSWASPSMSSGCNGSSRKNTSNGSSVRSRRSALARPKRPCASSPICTSGPTACRTAATLSIACRSSAELRQAIDKVAAVRQAVGPDGQIGLDAHGRFGLASALRLLRTLEPFDVFFLEEPLHPDDIDGLAQLTRQSRIPIILGERLYSRWDYRRLLEMHLAPIVQPDVIHVGGILELKKIG